jgi:hypothetical protein
MLDAQIMVHIVDSINFFIFFMFYSFGSFYGDGAYPFVFAVGHVKDLLFLVVTDTGRLPKTSCLTSIAVDPTPNFPIDAHTSPSRKRTDFAVRGYFPDGIVIMIAHIEVIYILLALCFILFILHEHSLSRATEPGGASRSIYIPPSAADITYMKYG